MNYNDESTLSTKAEGAPPPLGAAGAPLPCLNDADSLRFTQQPGESNRAFALFLEYVRMGPGRTFVKLAKWAGQSISLMKYYSRKHSWGARLAQRNQAVAGLEADATELAMRADTADWVQRQKEHREEEWRVRGEVLALARAAIQRWASDEQRPSSLGDIARLLDLASKLGRLAAGMPTQQTELKAEVGGQVDLDWEVVLKKVYGQPTKPIEVEARRLPDARTGPGVGPLQSALAAC